jgi:hypothetical protein
MYHCKKVYFNFTSQIAKLFLCARFKCLSISLCVGNSKGWERSLAWSLQGIHPLPTDIMMNQRTINILLPHHTTCHIEYQNISCLCITKFRDTPSQVMEYKKLLLTESSFLVESPWNVAKTENLLNSMIGISIKLFNFLGIKKK